MRLGEFIVGEYRGVDDTEYGSQLRVRVGEPQFNVDGSPKLRKDGSQNTGYEERIEFFSFSPTTGKPTLPSGLAVGDYVIVGVKVKSKGFRSQDRGISGMVTRDLVSITVVDVSGVVVGEVPSDLLLAQ